MRREISLRRLRASAQIETQSQGEGNKEKKDGHRKCRRLINHDLLPAFSTEEAINPSESKSPDDQPETVPDRKVNPCEWQPFHRVCCERVQQDKTRVEQGVDREQQQPESGVLRLHNRPHSFRVDRP